MPPCLDVYVWVPDRTPDLFAGFVAEYAESPDDERFRAFERVHILGIGDHEDADTLDEGDGVITLYLTGRRHYQAIVTLTRDGAAVLGLSVEAPDDPGEIHRRALRLLEELGVRFAGLAGVELPPPGDRAEWLDDTGVLLRRGLPPG